MIDKIIYYGATCDHCGKVFKDWIGERTVETSDGLIEHTLYKNGWNSDDPNGKIYCDECSGKWNDDDTLILDPKRKDINK